MTGENLTGSCLCGAVTYAVRPPWLRFVQCHCTRCRKATGSAHATNLYVLFGQLEWTAGAEHALRYDLPTAKSFSTTFCRLCGSPLPHHTRSRKEFVIPAGSLDDDPDMKLQIRIFWGSRAPWSCADDTLPDFDTVPEAWQPGKPLQL